MTDSQTRETAWVIESATGYWTGRDILDLEADHLEACRFARQQDAQRVLYWLIQNSGSMGKAFASALKVTEHIWITP